MAGLILGNGVVKNINKSFSEIKSYNMNVEIIGKRKPTSLTLFSMCFSRGLSLVYLRRLRSPLSIVLTSRV